MHMTDERSSIEIHFPDLCQLWDHSITTWQVDQILTNLEPSPLKWSNMDILQTNYPLSLSPCGLSTDPFPPLIVHVVIE